MKYAQKLLRVQLAGSVSLDGAIAFIRMWDAMKKITDEEAVSMKRPVSLVDVTILS